MKLTATSHKEPSPETSWFMDCDDASSPGNPVESDVMDDTTQTMEWTPFPPVNIPSKGLHRCSRSSWVIVHASNCWSGIWSASLNHIRTQHLDDLSGNSFLCPICDLECFYIGHIDEVIDHLLGHGYHTSLNNAKCYPKRKRQ